MDCHSTVCSGYTWFRILPSAFSMCDVPASSAKYGVTTFFVFLFVFRFSELVPIPIPILGLPSLLLRNSEFELFDFFRDFYVFSSHFTSD